MIVTDTRATTGVTVDAVTWDIPADLMRLQRDLHAAKAACSAALAGDDSALLEAARAGSGI